MRDETAFQTTTADEKQTLAAFLRFHQDTLAMKVDGVGEGEVRKPMVPSGVSLAGLLKHATYVHARWFEMCFGNETPTDLPWPTQDWAAFDAETIDVLVTNYKRHADIVRDQLDGTTGV